MACVLALAPSVWELRQQIDRLRVIGEEAVHAVGMMLIVPVCERIEFAVRTCAGFDAEKLAQVLPWRL